MLILTLSLFSADVQAEGGAASGEAAPGLQHPHRDPLGHGQPEEVSDTETQI